LQTLQLLPYKEYRGILKEYSVIFYYLPIFGYLYRHRVELCLAECTGGENILEIGFGSGLTFLNLSKMYKKIHGLDLTCDVEQVTQVFASHGVYPDLQNGDVLKMPYADDQFDTVLLISILEHLKPHELEQAFSEIRRVLKPGGQVVYGAPVERPFMIFMFRILGYNIHDYHFSTERDISQTAGRFLKKVNVRAMKALPSFLGDVYEIGHFVKI
jgi:ubiquinone/menaquinone biosynthesis C-methylase UbiE